MMFILTDGKRTIDLCLSIWDGKNYYDVTSWIMEMTVPYDEEKEARIVPDVQYCIDYAMEWRDMCGDFYQDRFNEFGDEIIITEERSVHVDEL